MRKTLRRCVCSGIVIGLLAWPDLAGAQSQYFEEADLGTAPAGANESQYLKDAGIGTATVAANVVYIPAKLGYALLGGLTGGMAYALTGGNKEVAERVWSPSMGGNYILSTDHLRGTEPIYFSAPTRLQHRRR